MCHPPYRVESMYHQPSRDVRPPAVSHLASSMNRFPCIFRCIYQRASRSAGLPIYTLEGLRCRPASLSMQIYPMGLPLGRASQVLTTRPPAWTGFRATSSF